jgi:hypothetical protein
MTASSDDATAALTPRAYRLLFAGELLPGFDEASVRPALARHLQRSPASLFSGKRVNVGEFADAVEANMARQAMQALGAQVLLEEVEAPPPMPALGLLDVALPSAPAAPAQQPSRENFAKTDSGWQPLSEGPAALPPLNDDLQEELLKTLAARHAEPETSTAAQAPSPVLLPSRPGPVLPGADLLAPAVAAAQSAAPAAAVGTALAVAQAPDHSAEVPDAAWIRCPACREHQPMRLLCCACGADLKRALAAQQEERAQARAASVARVAGNHKVTPGESWPQEEGVRVLGVRVPDEWAAKLTWPNVLLALFGSLLVLATIGYLWRALGLDPIFSSSKASAVATAPASEAVGDPLAAAPGSTATDPAAPGASPNTQTNASPAPSQADVATRLSSAAAVADFRSRYWPQPTNKVFVYSSAGTTAWLGGQPSIARAMALAMTDCESRRPPTAAPCRVVNVNDYWQD